MDYIIAEATSLDQVTDSHGNKLYQARELTSASYKFLAITKILESNPVSYFLKMGRLLANYLNSNHPLVFVTDWSDPTELTGLRLETEDGFKDYPGLCFIGFYTDWDSIEQSGINEIFAHEFSHVWLNWMGYDISRSLSNKFHTCTAITDPYMAFFEGFAEHLEIVTRDMSGYTQNGLWDYAYDVNAWLCARDTQLRYHGVINDRFVYNTALPFIDDYDTYAGLHMAHITSSAFMPERIKNANQLLASEGAVASIFYHIYINDVFKNRYSDKAFYSSFGMDRDSVDPVQNLYLKILYVMTRLDMSKPTLLTDFIKAYGDNFPDEKKELYSLFVRLTYFSTVSGDARHVFERLYSIGRNGEVEPFRTALRESSELKTRLIEQLLSGEVSLEAAVRPDIWIDGDEYIAPTPWNPEIKVRYKFCANSATAVDFLSMSGMTVKRAEQLIMQREQLGGFKSVEEFYELLERI